MEDQKNQKEQKKSNYSGLAKYAKYSGIAFQMLAIILVATWGGLKLDQKYNQGKPLFIIVLSILGVFAGLYVALRDFFHSGK